MPTTDPFLELVGYVSICLGTLLPPWMAYANGSWAKECRWLKVSGRVVSSHVILLREHYEPVVHYVYRHKGVEHRGETIRTRMPLYNASQPAQRLCSRYPRGTTVTVYVDPSVPSHSVLEPGSDFKLFCLTLAASLFLILSGFLLAKGHVLRFR